MKPMHTYDSPKTAADDPPSGRLHFIDSLRGLALVLMFTHHAAMWLMADRESSSLYFVFLAFGLLPVPLFMTIVGMCLVISAEKRMKAQEKNSVMKHVIKRGILLFLIGFPINLLFHTPITHINVIHMLGASMTILCGAAIKPTQLKSAAYLVALLFASAAAFTLNLTIGSPIVFETAPQLMTFTMLGIVAGQLLTYLRKNKRTQRFPQYLVLISLPLLAAASILPSLGEPFRLLTSSFSWSSLSLFALLTFWIIAFISWSYKMTGKRATALWLLEPYGIYSLPFYLIHFLFVVTIPTQLGLLNTLSETETIGYMIGFLAASWLLLDAFQKKRDKERCSH